MDSGQSLKTRIYVDGYNFYNGCLKRSEYKWVDLLALFKTILPTIMVSGHEGARSELAPLSIKYFTAPILANFARAKDSVSSQVAYHEALSAHLGSAIRIFAGYYDAKPARAYRHVDGQLALASEMVEIWKIEEKQSDVAMALHAYADAAKGEVDQVVLVTNDTDLEPALRMIREETKVVVGVIIPTCDGSRKPNQDLVALAHWHRSSVLRTELADSQLPTLVRKTGGVIHKPISWYPRPDLLEPIITEARRVKRSFGAAMKWLNTPCAYLDNRIPIAMAGNDDEAGELMAYMAKYAKDFNI